MSAPFTLTSQEIAFFKENGYVGPFDLGAPDQVSEVRRLVDEDLLTRQSPIYGGESRRDWHLASRPLFDLCSQPAIVERLAGILGEDLLLWRTQMFYKKPGDGETAWHQDYNFPGPFKVPSIEPPVTVSAWIALDEATIENGCVELIAGSHTEGRIHTTRDESGAGIFGRNYKLDREIGGDDRIVRMTIKPGQFFLFSNMTVHGSGPNNSETTRLGIGARFTTTDVRVYGGQQVDGQGMNLDRYGCVLVHGANAFDHNRMRTPPDGSEVHDEVVVDSSRDNGVKAGYRLGFMKGQRHAARGTRVDLGSRELIPKSALLHASKEYGDTALYAEGFKEGIVAGYDDGFEGRAFNSRYGSPLDAETTRRGGGPIRRLLRFAFKKFKHR